MSPGGLWTPLVPVSILQADSDRGRSSRVALSRRQLRSSDSPLEELGAGLCGAGAAWPPSE